MHRSINAIPRAEWDKCFPGEAEGWAYHRAVEGAGLPGFEFRYLVVEESGTALAVAPAFMTEYNLGTTVQGASRSALERVAQVIGRLLTLRLLCIGSPLTDKCALGLTPALGVHRRQEVVALMLTALDRLARETGIGLLAAKDVAVDGLPSGVGEAFAQAGFSRLPSLPNAALYLPFEGEEDYLKSLSRSARRDVKRKLRTAGEVGIQVLRGREALGHVDELARLYDLQRSASSVDFDQFEALTPAYFRNVLSEEAMNPIVFLYSHGGRIVAFNLCYHSSQVFVDKFIGFDQGIAKDVDLYVLSWMTNVRYCLSHGIAALQTGQTGYAMKRRLGSALEPGWIFFRHRNPAVNLVLRLAGPLLAPARYDKSLGDSAEGAA